MKHPDFDKAFAPTPEIARLSIEAAFRKGEKAMKLRHKITAMVSAAAVLAIVCTAAVFALPNEPRPDVVSQPRLSNETEPAVSPTEEPTVYYTSKGVYYHNIEDCSGMLGAESHALSEARADGKEPCPVCVKGEVETDWSFDEAESTAAPMPYGGSVAMDADGSILEAESYPAPVTAAPTPAPMHTEMPGEEEGFPGWENDETVYYTEEDKYRHYDEHCSGMMNAHAHTLTEALRAGKEPCPVCVQSQGIQPADHMCAIGMEYFMEIFDRGIFETFPHTDMEASGKQTDDYIWEEAVYTNDNGLYLAVYREMNKDTLISGRIALMFPEDFDYDLFFSEGTEWYRNTYALAMETLVSMPMNSHINKLSSALKQVYVYFDGEVRPNVCEMEFETDGGFFSLSFDINGDEPSFATINYNKTMA